MSHWKTVAALALWAAVMATHAVAHDPIVSAKAEQPSVQNAVPLYDNLGDLRGRFKTLIVSTNQA